MHTLTARVHKFGILSKLKPTPKRQILNEENIIKSMIGHSLSMYKIMMISLIPFCTSSSYLLHVSHIIVAIIHGHTSKMFFFLTPRLLLFWSPCYWYLHNASPTLTQLQLDIIYKGMEVTEYQAYMSIALHQIFSPVCITFKSLGIYYVYWM
jgi:hypothetical protein